MDKKTVSKQRQIKEVQEIATSCSPSMTDAPRNPSPSRSPMTDTVMKMVDIKNEPEQELAKLPHLKEDALTVIRRLENEEYKPLPENTIFATRIGMTLPLI
ncbi:MAG: hypothetical protein Q4C48_11175 [Lachnospiraceae bacterium]|nr:hypothetical protein [Lachnospiraceae bacterium]